MSKTNQRANQVREQGTKSKSKEMSGTIGKCTKFQPRHVRTASPH